jgi:hypothetical protein
MEITSNIEGEKAKCCYRLNIIDKGTGPKKMFPAQQGLSSGLIQDYKRLLYGP